MTLQQTLSSGNSALTLGNIQIQPVNDVSGIVLSAKTVPALNSLGGVAAHEVPISPSMLHYKNNNIELIKNIQFNSIIEDILSDEVYVLAPMESKYNTISLAFPTVSTSKQKIFSEKIKSKYENLTNVSQERPEIISMIDFLPIFENEKYQQRSVSDNDITTFMTSAGKFVNTQMQVRNLLYDNMSAMIESLKKINSNLSSMCDKTNSDFYNQLLALRTILQTLYRIVSNTNKMKRSFSLHDESYIIDAPNIIDAYAENYSQVASTDNLKLLYANYEFTVKSLVDVFTKLGYVEKNVKTFSSTKIWLQLLSEYKTILSYHTPGLLDLDYTIQKNDTNATNINNAGSLSYFYVVNDAKTATLSTFLAQIVDTPTVTNISQIEQKFGTLYSTSFKSDEIKISALLFFLSKEYRYSLGITENAYVLLNAYNYTVIKSDYSSRQPENVKMFDAIFGNQKNITQLSTNKNSISTLSQLIDSNQKILTFETEQINLATNSFLPGSEYYFSDNLTDVTKISTFSVTVDQYLQSFCKLSSVLDILYSNKSNTSSYSDALNNPTDIFNTFVLRFQNYEIADDILSPVFALANSSLELKAALFLYVMSVIDIRMSYIELFECIINTIQRNTIDVTKTLKTTPSSDMLLTNEMIESSLFDGTNILLFLREFFSDVGAKFNVLNDSYTAYSGLSNLTLYMVMFDVFVAYCAKMTTKKILGQTYINNATQQSVLTYVLASTGASSQTLNMTIVGKLNQEIATTQLLFYTVYAILTNLQSSIKSYINNVKFGNAEETINTITNFIGSDKQNFLMSTQQIYSLNNSLMNVFEKYKETSSTFKSLDDFSVSSTLRDIFFGVFSDPTLTSAKGNNKKLLSVGIPLGLSDSLRRQTNIETLVTYDDKQIDLVNLCVYKIDIINDDIVYKPQKFLFDLSRFVPRDDTLYLQNSNKTLVDVVKAIPTRDASIVYDSTNVQYYSPSNTALTAAFDATYSFLSYDQKYQIAKNHILSFFVEMYVKFLTGVSVSEDSFVMSDVGKLVNTDLLRQMINTYVMLATTSTSESEETNSGGILFSNALQTNSVQTQNVSISSLNTQQAIVDINSNLSQISQNNFDSVLHGVRTINGLSYTLTSLSDKDKCSSKLLAPKIFDRVFNLIIDPDDFEIDVEQTNKSPTGTQSLLQLISTGDVVATIVNSTTKVPTTLASNVVRELAAGTGKVAYTFINKDKNVGDSTFEKYFVTIETFSQNTTINQ